MKNSYYSTSIFPLWLYPGCAHRSISKVADETQCSHHSCSLNHLQGPESHSTRVQLCWKDNVLKLLKKLFRSMKNNMQHFFSSVTKKFEAASNQPPSSQHSKALTESLFLTLLHRKKFPFIFHLFSFLPERQKRVGFYVHQTRTELFCSVLDCGCLPPTYECIPELPQKKKNQQYCPSDFSMACTQRNAHLYMFSPFKNSAQVLLIK